MGLKLCTSNTNDVIGKQNEKDHKMEKRILKLLILGTGDAGKSTIVKQMQKLYGDGISESDIAKSAPQVYMNILFSFKNLLRASSELGIPLDNESLLEKFNEMFSTKHSDITEEGCSLLEALWKDKGIQELWINRYKFSVYENLEYYMSEINRIAVGLDKYKVTLNDYLNVKIRTVGVRNYQFRLYKMNFDLIDVGGQRGERDKWLPCFSNVLCVLFVASIAEYDATLFEASEINREDDSLRVWGDMINRSDFANVGFVLFLNKLDLFKKKLLKEPYRNEGKKANLDYEGLEPCAVAVEEQDKAIISCMEHTKLKYLDRVDGRGGDGLLKTHFSTALDPINVDQIFKDSKATILNNKLRDGGFPMLMSDDMV